MSKIKKSLYFTILLAILPITSYAAPIIQDPTGMPATDASAVITLINTLQGFVNAIAGMLAFLVIAWGAFVLATAGGSAEKAANGKKILLYGLGGAIFIVLAYAITKIIVMALGGQVI